MELITVGYTDVYMGIVYQTSRIADQCLVIYILDLFPTIILQYPDCNRVPYPITYYSPVYSTRLQSGIHDYRLVIRITYLELPEHSRYTKPNRKSGISGTVGKKW